MRLLYMNCPPEVQETLLHHTREFAEVLKELFRKYETRISQFKILLHEETQSRMLQDWVFPFW